MMMMDDDDELAVRFTPKWTKNKIIESWGGARAPVPHSWRRHWLRLLTVCRLTEQI